MTRKVVWLIAVLCMQLVSASNHQLGDQSNRGALNESTLTYPEIQALIRKESGKEGLPVVCCPIIEEMVEPQGGINRQDMYVELYRDGENAQRFFEYSCRPDVLDKPCRFIDRELQTRSRCVQKYSHTYAIIPTTEGEQHREHRRKLEQSQPRQERQFPTFPGNGSISSAAAASSRPDPARVEFEKAFNKQLKNHLVLSYQER